MKRFNVLNSFTLKIIAMVSMAIDHLGVILMTLWGVGLENPLFATCRYLGRFAMPLYCFMLVEGVIHTKNYKKYSLRLGILAVVISSALAVASYVPSLGLYSITWHGNIFMDLFLGSLMVYTLNHKNKYVKLIALIPLALGILSFTAKCIEYSSSCTSCGGLITIHWFPRFLRFQYDWFSLALILGYFFAYKCTMLFYKIREENTGISAEMMIGTNEARIATNLFALLFTILANALYYSFKYINNAIVWWLPELQLFSIVAGVLLLFYSGKVGYHKKWFVIFSYLYYPLHIVLIYGICYLIYIL